MSRFLLPTLPLLLAACLARPDDSGAPGPSGRDSDSGASVGDADGDGYTAGEGDCDDGDAAIHPGAEDTVGDGGDQDCDGIDGVDADGDGHASEGSAGDVNADGTPDLAVGAWAYQASSTSNGAVFILLVPE